MTNANSEKSIRRQKEQAKKDAEVDRSIVQALMSRPDGRRWIWLRLSDACIFHEDPNLDPYRAIYMKGIRNEGLRLLRSVQRHAPSQYVLMTQENTGINLQMEDIEANQEEDSEDNV